MSKKKICDVEKGRKWLGVFLELGLGAIGVLKLGDNTLPLDVRLLISVLAFYVLIRTGFDAQIDKN